MDNYFSILPVDMGRNFKYIFIVTKRKENKMKTDIEKLEKVNDVSDNAIKELVDFNGSNVDTMIMMVALGNLIIEGAKDSLNNAGYDADIVLAEIQENLKTENVGVVNG